MPSVRRAVAAAKSAACVMSAVKSVRLGDAVRGPDDVEPDAEVVIVG